MNSRNCTYADGNALLDADDQILFDLVDQLDDAMETGQSHDVVASVINVLAEYVEYHFHREESLLVRCGFPDIETHARHHRLLEAQFFSARDLWLTGRWDALSDSARIALKKGLTDHVKVTDKSYRPWLDRDVSGHGKCPSPPERG